MLRALGQIWAAGGNVDWPAVHGRRRTLVPLPTYPFDHERYWIDAVAAARADAPDRAGNKRVDRRRGAGARGTRPRRGGARRDDPPSDGRGRRVAAGSVAAPAAAGSRRDRIVVQLATILSDLSGIEPTALDPKASFADLGFDSLFLTQANAQFRKQFGVRITFRQIFEEAPSIDSLAGFIDAKLAPDAFPAPEQPAAQAPDAGGRSRPRRPRPRRPRRPRAPSGTGSCRPSKPPPRRGARTRPARRSSA